MITIDKKNKDDKEVQNASDIVTFYKTEKLKDINNNEVTIKSIMEEKSEKQLLIEKEQAEAVINEYTNRLDDINNMLASINN